MSVHYVLAVLGGSDSYALMECRYDPKTGQHRLGKTLATGTLDEMVEMRDLF